MSRIHPEVLRRFGRDPKIIFNRDNNKCVLCGSEKYLTIDHIDGHGCNYKTKDKNNNLENLRTLCRICHGHIDGIKGRGKKHHGMIGNRYGVYKIKSKGGVSNNGR